eukprot:TRINITY_DN1065_c0_g1_i1.p1 TRINITY_DN1065_c0_g1~~TRINITY_DN1065_c0_g1_i1.p1  ORF type:complete len:332 (+),score=62.70 TRINITY_DN1065_c0_g1_i1:95-1090(+)
MYNPSIIIPLSLCLIIISHTYQIPVASWERKDLNPRQFDHVMEYVEDLDVTFIFGGIIPGYHYTNQTYLLVNGTQVMSVVSVGDVPPPMKDSASATTKNVVYIHGGQIGGRDVANYLWRVQFIVDSNAESGYVARWSIESKTGPVYANHSMKLYGDKLFLFGEEGFYSYNLVTKVWKSVKEGPVPRSFTSLNIVSSTIYMFAGIVEAVPLPLNDLWAFNAVSEEWSQIEYKSEIQPLPRSGHVSFIIDNCLYAFGGETIVDEVDFSNNDLWMFNMTSGLWSEVAVVGVVPEPVLGNRVVQTKNGVVISGGINTDWSNFYYWSPYFWSINFH